MLEYNEKYKAYAEEFPEAIICWDQPKENHTEAGKAVIASYNEHYYAIASEIMYEVGDMVAAFYGDCTIKKIYDLYFENEEKAYKKLRRLLGKPIIYPDIEVLYYYEPPYKKIKCIELGYENNFEEVWTQSVSDSELAIKR